MTDGAIVLTGAAGFLGFHTARALLARGETVVGLDNLNAYYDPALKRGRLAELQRGPGAERFRLIEADLADAAAVRAAIAEDDRVDRVVHLAAQAGVRYSLEAPFAYAQANLTGHLAVLEAVRATQGRVRHLVYASSSSVYGDRAEGAFNEDDPVDRPVSLYAATKRADELLSQSYAHLYGLPMSGLRFFTVYGPWGRPDMAYWLFTDAIFAGRPIELFNEGRMRRDFTYVDDAVAAVLAVLDRPAAPGENVVLNVGNSRPEPLGELVSVLERETGREAVKILRPMQAGDVTSTYADIGRIEALVGWRPQTRLEDGLAQFVQWYRRRYVDTPA